MADRSARKLAASLALAFLAGFVAVLTFHQGMLGLLHALGVTPATPFNFGRTARFGIPEVISSCKPIPAEDLRAYPISTRVNSPRNDDADILEKSAVG